MPDPLLIHPAANLFPPMPVEALRALAADIAANGLIEPVLLYRGLVLDGRNRLAACALVNVTPRFAEADIPPASSPLLYVVSKNLHRRHLTKSQRAAMAAELMPRLQEEALERKREAGRKHGKAFLEEDQTITSGLPFSTGKGQARDLVSVAMEVGTTFVSQALRLRKEDPVLFEEVKAGTLLLTKAMGRLAKSTAPANPPTPSPVGKRQQVKDRMMKDLLVRRLGEIHGLTLGLEGFDKMVLDRALTENEWKLNMRFAEESAYRLRKFTKRMKGQDADAQSERETKNANGEDAGDGSPDPPDCPEADFAYPN